jgi:hypothetical protein
MAECELSDRARRFMRTWERRPYVEDLGLVRAALEEAAVPITDAVLDFHRTFAGYMTDVWGDEGPLGIIHRGVGPQSWYEPMKVGGYLKGDGRYLACADIHMSWEMMIALDGTFHCNGPESSSCFLWTEQCAFVWECHQRQRLRRLLQEADADEVAETFLPQLTGHRIDSLSDQYGQVFATESLLVTVGQSGQRYNVWVAEGAGLTEIPGFRGQLEKRKKPLAELQQDLLSKYSGRRYRAVCELRETTDPAAAPLFLSVVNDENKQTRLMAIQGLGRVRSAEAVPALAGLIRGDEDEMIALNAVMALKSIGGSSTFPALVQATRHRAAFIRRDAAIALGAVGDRSVLPALERLLQDDAAPKKYTGLCPTQESRPVAQHAQEAIDKVTARGARG